METLNLKDAGYNPATLPIRPNLEIEETPVYKDIFNIVQDHDKARQLFQIVESQKTQAAVWGLGTNFLNIRADADD